ncbi:MAG: hypothetical protein ACKVZ6_23890 [Kineosporiaceae bacterium]
MSAAAPEVHGLRRTVPGVVLRSVVLAAGGLALAAVCARRDAGWFFVLAGLLLLAAAAAPDSPAATGFLVVLVGLQGGLGGLDARLPVAVAGAYVVHVGCALAAAVPLDARLERSALRGPALRAVTVLGTAGLAAAVTAVAADAGVRTGEVLGVTVGLVVAAAVLALVARSAPAP